jgi:hypothetical protein
MSGKRKISSKHQIFSFFVRFLFKLKFKDIFSLLFQCGPRDPSSSLMRSPSHFEFKTPDLKVDKKNITNISLHSCDKEHFTDLGKLNFVEIA